ncbi:MAG TPA: hypothetical protein PKK69_10565, partial [Ferruginibacter sp.]|nr:hypothetical protein [Ferruginibacter sp.]
NTPACVTQTYSARELCGELGNVSFYSNYCTYGTCGWACPTDKADFTMNVTQDPITKVWTAHVCYTGGTIPAGHSIQVIYWMKTACRDLLVDTVQICSSTNGCVDVTYQDDEVCKKVYEYGITSFNCINADCQWDCPTDLKLYTASFTQNENGSDWDVTICYNGPTIPANTLVTVYFDLETRCGVLRDSVQFCASSGNCITKTFLKDQVCGVVGSVRIRTVVCSSGNCDWKCPTDLGLYTFNYVHNPTTGDWDLTICYNGPAIPPGKTVTVHYWLKTACGGIEDSLKFCSSSPVCVTKTYSNRSVCGDIGDGGLISVDCSDADCNWECPTKLSLYNITYQQTGNYWEVKVCYTGPAIPVGTAVTAYFQLQTRCGNVITDSVKFCSTSGNCIILQ